MLILGIRYIKKIFVILTKLFETEKFDIVYHIAAITPLPDCQSNPIEAVDVNVRDTVILLDLSKKYNIKKFLFASTSAVYENNTDFPSIEHNVAKPSLIYPSTKYSSEQFLKAYYDAYNISITCFRFANVYGPHIDCLRLQPPVIGYIIRELFYNRTPILYSNGDQKRDFIYIDDLIDLCVKAINISGYDTINVSSNEVVSINYIANVIKKQMNKEYIDIIYENTDKYWDKYPILYEKPYPINKDLLNKEVLKCTCLSNNYAKNNFDWYPKINIEEGIKRTIDFSIKVLEKNG